MLQLEGPQQQKLFWLALVLVQHFFLVIQFRRRSVRRFHPLPPSFVPSGNFISNSGRSWKLVLAAILHLILLPLRCTTSTTS